jgi:hypothetical protein
VEGGEEMYIGNLPFFFPRILGMLATGPAIRFRSI